MLEQNNKTNNNSITPTPPKSSKQTSKIKPKQAKTTAEAARFKAKYFEYYDDVKTHNNGPYDW